MAGYLKRLLLSLVVLLPLAATPVHAQGFGKNKVQYTDFDWTVIRTEHFEIYFYGGERQTALDAARMAERSYAHLSHALNHEVDHPIPVILYASHTDFQQTNITEGLIDEGTGGITELFKQRVFLPFTGSYGELEHVLTHEMVHAFEMDMIYGDALGLVSNPLGFQPPLWLMEGLAEYLSLGGVDVHTKMWLRDAALEGYLISIPQLGMARDIRVYRFGQSICDYIARHYGEEKLGDLLRRAPEARDIDEAFKDVIGVPASKLSELWMEEIRRTYLPEIANHQKPTDFATRLTEQGGDLSRLNVAPSISPKGDRMVFISDRSLYQDIYLASAIDGKIIDRLVKGERSGDLESLRFLNTSLTWSPDEKRIAFVAKAGARDVIYIFDVAKKKSVEIHVDLDGLVSPAWSPDGEKIAFVGLEGGQSDLFVVNRDGSDIERLTHDRYMDRDPDWSPDGTRLTFTTDRGPWTDFDSLRFADPRVGILTLADRSISILPNQEGKNVDPCWSPDGKYIAFLSDRTGASNIFAVDTETDSTYQLTDVLSGIVGITPDSPALSWSRQGDRMAFCAFTQGGYDIYAWKSPLDAKKPYVPRTPAPTAAVPVASTQATPDATLPEAVTPEMLEGTATPDLATPDLATPDLATPDTAAPGPETPALDGTAVAANTPAEPHLAAPGEGEPSSGEVATPVISEPAPAEPAPARFDSVTAEVAEGTPPPDTLSTSLESGALPDTTSFTISPYKTHFTRDFTVGGAAFASNVGFAGQTALSFSDILGNHTIYVAASVFGSLTDSDILLSYTNRRHRTNYGAAIFQYRNDYLVQTAGQDDGFESRIYRGVELSFSRPFSKFTRAEWAMQAVSVSESVYRNWYYGRPVDVQDRGTLYFVSPSVALVTDNVIFGYNGALSGTRSRFEFIYTLGDLHSTTQFIDWRHYTNMRHRYVLATRLLGALSEGRNAELFRVGGPFNFRGTDWGDVIGSCLAISNVEFRFPLIDHLEFVWPLALDFRGIEGVFFFDTATAWSNGGGVWLDSQRQSTLGAYGFGARLNLGVVNLRYDLAQATDFSRQVGPTRHFFTIGYDY